MMFTHSDAMQSHLDGIARTQAKSDTRKDAKRHSEYTPSQMQQMESLADQLDQTMCSIVMEMFRISEEIKTRQASGGDAAGAVLTVEDLTVQLRKLAAQKVEVGQKLEKVNKQIMHARD